jgi:hypothetical protein
MFQRYQIQWVLFTQGAKNVLNLAGKYIISTVVFSEDLFGNMLELIEIVMSRRYSHCHNIEFISIHIS